MDAVTTARLQLLYPPLAAKLTNVFTQMESEGEESRLTQGLRSWSEQDALYAQGRTTPGPECAHNGVAFPIGTCSKHPLGLTVTNCKGGCSYHNFGLAGDGVPSKFGPGTAYEPDWNPNHPAWKRMEEIAVSQGLAIGAAWRSYPDAPHMQLTGRFPEGEPSDELKQIFRDGGTQAVWDEVTRSLN